MTTLEIAMMCLGWLGMVLILVGMHQKKRFHRQLLLSIGASMLTIMVAVPSVHKVFFCLQLAVTAVGFINFQEGRQKITLPLIIIGALASSFFAFHESAGLDTWLAIIGLTGVAAGYASQSEREGGNQSLWFAIGGFGLVGYSLFGVFADVWQAWPYLVLNSFFGFFGLRDTIKERRRRTTA